VYLFYLAKKYQHARPFQWASHSKAVYIISFLVALTLLSACSNPLSSSSPSSSKPSPTIPGQPSPTSPSSPGPVASPYEPGSGADAALSQCYHDSFGGCFSPEEVQTFYGLNSLYAQGFNGKGVTIVIAIDGGSSTIESDLHTFDQTFGLPDPPSIKSIAPFGTKALAAQVGPDVTAAPSAALSAASETTLDVEWAHAIAPGANIVILLSPAETWPAYEQTAAYAIQHHLGQIFSYSLGEAEPSLENSSCDGTPATFKNWDQQVFQPAAAAHITILAASGDDGPTNPDCTGARDYNFQNVSWPASDPLVTAVGGTKMKLQDEAGDYGSERVWNEGGASGGGISEVFSEPDWQKSLPNQVQLQGKRGVPDVSWGAATNFPTYHSYPGSTPGWRADTGTSISTPQWAGLVAIADQMAGKPLGLINPALYSLAGKGFHDITTGNNVLHGVTGFPATPGWDLSTGWGTPNGSVLVPLLVAAVEQLGG
jgi:subtilase family serine protease